MIANHITGIFIHGQVLGMMRYILAHVVGQPENIIVVERNFMKMITRTNTDYNKTSKTSRFFGSGHSRFGLSTWSFCFRFGNIWSEHRRHEVRSYLSQRSSNEN